MMRRLPVWILLVALGACRDAPAPVDDAPPVPPVTVGSRTVPPTEAWPETAAAGAINVQRERQYDLTGDGIGERTRVTAMGSSYDSLDVTLVIANVGGDTLWIDRWNSALYFKDQQRAGADGDACVVQAHVDSLLHDSRFSARGLPQRLRQGSVAHVPDESIGYHLAELDWRNSASLEPRDPTPREAHDRIAARSVVPERVRAVRQELEAGPIFMYHAGGEATYVIGWSVREHAFVRLYACC
jgi:hypothetical protein